MPILQILSEAQRGEVREGGCPGSEWQGFWPQPGPLAWPSV